MKVQITEARKVLYAKSIKAFFEVTAAPFQKAKLKTMLKQTERDHQRWLHRTGLDRQELARRKEEAEDRRHQEYLESVGRRVNAFSNQEKIARGERPRPYIPHR